MFVHTLTFVKLVVVNGMILKIFLPKMKENGGVGMFNLWSMVWCLKSFCHKMKKMGY
jgi:hypothetical protein